MRTSIERKGDITIVNLFRRGRKEKSLRMGSKHIHVFITHPDGTITDCGISENLLTNAGRDLWDAAFGHSPMHAGTHTTAPTATLITDSALGGAAGLYNGWRAYSPVTGLTTPLVYANCGAGGSATTIVTDQWWTAADAVGTVPALSSVYLLQPCCVPRFMGLSTSVTATATDTVLPGPELNASGLSRAKATYAHTGGASTYTMQTVYTVTAGPTTVGMMGLFTAMNLTAGGVMVFETVLSATATVNNGDTLTVTDTITTTG
jgi:hypothetical protein